jgi:hypothetical protein
MMKPQRFAIVLTVINLGLLFCLLAQTYSAGAQNAPAVPPVLRGRALEIVDDQGRVRASITVLEPSSRLARSTVILRLIDPNGRPEVKITASEQGAELGFVGDSDTTQAHLAADGPNASLKLMNKDGKQQMVKP